MHAFSRPALRRPVLVLASAAALALAAAGCGDDEDTSANDREEIAAVVEKALTTTDPKVKCEEVVTKGFVSTVYGDLATCTKAETAKAGEDDEKATGATTSGVKIDGETATATVTVEGGDTAGATGQLSFEQEDGAWKVSELGLTFLRSQLDKGLANSADEADSPFADAKVRQCVSEGFAGLDEAEFRKLAYASIRDEEPDAKFVEIITTCATNSSDATDSDDAAGDDDTTSTTEAGAEPSLLRRQFEEGIRESAQKDGATAAQIDCVVKKLRTTISDDDIVEQVKRGADDVSNELAGKAAEAIAECGAAK